MAGKEGGNLSSDKLFISTLNIINITDGHRSINISTPVLFNIFNNFCFIFIITFFYIITIIFELIYIM